MPNAWKAVNTSTTAAKGDFVVMASALMAQAEMLRRAEREMQSYGRQTERAASGFERMQRSVRDMGRHIKEATAELLKWSTITGAVGGLLGAGGLFGIERLAQAGAGMRRNAMGMGTQPFSQQAFGLSFGRLVDPGQFLGGTQEALSDVTKRWTLYGAGLNDRQMRGDPTQVATQLLPAIRRIVQQTDPSQLAQVMQARGLNQFIGLQDAQRLRGMSEEEFQSLLKQKVELEREQHRVTVDQLRTWTELNNRLQIAGQRIENAFIIGLGRLTPELTKLSDAFSKVASNFLQSDAFKHWIDLAAQGLEQLDKWISGPTFQKDVENFVTGVGEMAKALGNAVKWLTSFFPDNKPGGSTPSSPGAQLTPGSPFPSGTGWSWNKFWGNIGGALEPIWPKTSDGKPKRLGDFGSDILRQLNPVSTGNAMEAGGAHAMAAAGNVPPEARGLLSAIASRESEGAANRLGVSPYNVRYTPGGGAAFGDLSEHPRIYEQGPAGPSSAAGRYQFTYRTWAAFARRLGLKDFSAKSQDTAAWADAQDVYRRATGRNLSADLRAHNFDPKAVPAFKREWSSVRPDLPQLTERYGDPIGGTIAQRHPDMPAGYGTPGVNIQIHNQTGGSAVVTGSQIAQ